jgi:hypothetical protein
MMRQKFLTIHVKEVHLEFLLFYILQRCNKFCSRSELRITPKKIYYNTNHYLSSSYFLLIKYKSSIIILKQPFFEKKKE